MCGLPPLPPRKGRPYPGSWSAPGRADSPWIPGDQVFQRRGARAGLIGGDYAGTEIGPLRHLKLGKIIFQTKLLKAFGENRNHGHYPFRGSVGRMQPFGKFLRVPPVSAFFYFIENNTSEGVVNSTFRRIKNFFCCLQPFGRMLALYD